MDNTLKQVPDYSVIDENVKRFKLTDDDVNLLNEYARDAKLQNPMMAFHIYFQFAHEKSVKNVIDAIMGNTTVMQNKKKSKIKTYHQGRDFSEPSDIKIIEV